MKIIKDLKKIKLKNPVIALGTFDGVHLGHQRIIKETVKFARKTSSPSVALTFHPHPQLIVCPERGLRLLTTLEERAYLISKLGVDILLPLRFDHKIQRLSYEQFIREFLGGRLKTQRVFVGFDYAFGRGREGNIAELKKLGTKYGFKVGVVKPLKIRSQVVKSSIIRELLSGGEVKKANRFLGYNYSLCGTVIKGTGRGRTLGAPTANLKVDIHKLVPAHGVYVGQVYLGRRKHKAVINIGARPTFRGDRVAVETHILNFNKNILGRKLRIDLLGWLREEKQFSDVEELKVQIRKDIEKAKKILKRH